MKLIGAIINIISQCFITDQVMRSISSIGALLERAIQLIGGSLLISYFSCAQRIEVKDMMPYVYLFNYRGIVFLAF